jgi:hypothetical protein
LRYDHGMATQLYDLTIPIFLRGFASFAAFLEKGRAWAEEQGIAPDTLLAGRIHPDMHPLPYQVQRASDAAKFAAVRLGQVESVAMADEEASFADLQARIARTVTFLESVPAAAINGREEAEIEIKLPNRSFTLTGLAYAQGFAVPNFYFHMTTSYAILRMQGVPVGKMDFLGGV